MERLTVLADVFDHESVSLSIHVCAYEGRQVEIGSAIEIQFVLEHLVHGICWSTILRDDEFGDLVLGIVSGGVRGQ
jgi:hypothetical protein